MTGILSTWQSPPQSLSIVQGEVHVWCVPLEFENVQLQEISACLDEDELERAGRYHFERDRRRFIVRRGRLRQILARYLRESADRIGFQYGQFGKPQLAANWHDAGLDFSSSHSDEMALVAVAIRRQMGVDVEKVRTLDDLKGLLKNYFTATERAQLDTLPAEQHLTAFFRGWTQKEALLKATGNGLSFPPDKLSVSLLANQPPRLISGEGDFADAGSWQLAALQPAPEFVAALAYQGERAGVKQWLWSSAG